MMIENIKKSPSRRSGQFRFHAKRFATRARRRANKMAARGKIVAETRVDTSRFY